MMGLRVFIPTKNRAESIRTHHVFEGADYKVIVHDEAQAESYVRGGVVAERIQVSGVLGDAFGLTRQREWVVQNLAYPGEWIIFADDNIRRMTCVSEEWYGYDDLPVKEVVPDYWRRVYGTECPLKRFMVIADDMASRADQAHLRLGGFASVGNYFYRTRKWSLVGYVIGKCYLVKNEGLTYDHTLTMEDFRNTAQHLLEDGAVLINRFIWAEAGHYEAGGMGTYAERVEHRRRDVRQLMWRYPGLFRVKDRHGFEPGTDLQLALHTTAQVANWRANMRARGKVGEE